MATQQLTVTHTDPSGTETDVTAEADYVSSDEMAATVSGGLITSVGAGATEVDVSYEGLTATVAVTVTVEEALEATPATVELTHP